MTLPRPLHHPATLPALSALTLALLGAWPSAASAQSAAPAAPGPAASAPAGTAPATSTPPAVSAEAGGARLAPVVVTGRAASLRSALDKQRESLGIVSVVHADAIGALPDANAAEALARLPGVSVERDQGEGRFVRVRGLGPDYNAVTINGATAPASEADRRAPGLDVVPAGLIRSLVVNKTLTPADDANSLGGSVAVNTLSAFDLPGRLFTVEAGLNHDANAGQSRPRTALTFADRFLDGTLGVAFSISRDQRRFASDNVETGGAWDANDLEEVEWRRYEILRRRTGAALNLDFKPAPGRHVWLRAFGSRFDDVETRQALAVEFDEAQADGASGPATAVRSLKSREEKNRSHSVVLGTELRLQDWKLVAEGGQGRASESKPGALAGADFEASFDGVGFRGTRRPALVGPTGLSGNGYEFDEMVLEDSRATDRVRHLKLDVQRGLDLAGDADVVLQAGLKTTRRDKRNEQETWAFDADGLTEAGVDPAALAMARLSAGSVRHGWSAIGPALDAAALRALTRGLDRADFREDEDSTVNDFRMRERVDAFYGQLRWEQGGSQVLAGLRHERIDFRADGFAYDDETISATAARSASRHWLPALMWRQDLGGPATQWRMALTHGVLRPTFGQLSPGRVIDGDEAELGNPLLRPLRSRNLDLGLEHGLGQGGRDGSASVYLFHKRIKDFVFQTDLAGTPGWEDFSAVHTWANGSRASVKGLELAYSQVLRHASAPWNGLVLGANATFTRSRAGIGGHADGAWQGRDIALPGQSDRTLNLSVGWEGPRLSARLAFNHKSPWLLEVGDVFDADKDLKVDAQTQVDLSLRWQWSKRLELQLEALNLTDAKYYVYQASRDRNAQYEQYGRALKVGLKLAVY